MSQGQMIPAYQMPAQLNVRITSGVKAELDAMASREGKNLQTYLRDHFNELITQGKIRFPTEEIQIPNPYVGTPYGAPAIAPGYPAGGYPPAPYYNPTATVDPQMDILLNDMRKMLSIKMMQQMIMGLNTPEQYARAVQGQLPEARKDFSMEDMMKWNMMNQASNQQFEREQTRLQMARDEARLRGDKTGETNASNSLIQLMTLQMQQNQAFTQQLMAMQQGANQTQQTLFTTALGANRQTEETAKLDRQQSDQRFMTLMGQNQQIQVQGMQQYADLQKQQLTMEIERIKSEKHDIIEQVAAFVELKNKNPVYKAVFDQAFGTGGGGLGDLIPKLKDLGIDKLGDKLLGILGGMVGRPVVPPPAIPQPAPSAAIPAPAPIALPGAAVIASAPQPQQIEPPLEQLRLPPLPVQRQRPVASNVQNYKLPPTSDETIGYTNINRPQDMQEETVQIAPPEVTYQVEEQPQPPPPPQQEEEVAVAPPDNTVGYTNINPPEPQSFTVGRPPGSKDKQPRKRRSDQPEPEQEQQQQPPEGTAQEEKR
jgi:hypothetical protein